MFRRAKAPLSPIQRTIRRARRVLTGGRWFLIAGLVFYSLMTTTPFVAEHSEWAWSGAALGLIVDAAFIMSLSAESTLAQHGVTKLGAWPTAFRWLTGLSSVFLNIWVSVEASDWVGVAVHLIAPALVMLLAEVGPIYMAALSEAERKATKADAPAEPYRTALSRNATLDDMLKADVAEHQDEPADLPDSTTQYVTDSALTLPPEPEELVWEALDTAAEQADDVPATFIDADKLADAFTDEPAARLPKAEADRIIREGWKHRLSVDEVATAATRHPATVRRRFKELDAELSV